MELFKKLKRYKGFKTIRYTYDCNLTIIALEHKFSTIIELASYVHSLKDHVEIKILNSNNDRTIYKGSVSYFIDNTPSEINKEIYV